MKKVIVLALAAIMVLGVAGAAFADSVTYPTTPTTPPATTTAGKVNVKAKVNPKITLTLTTYGTDSQTVDFGSVDPGVTAGQKVDLAIKSNKQFDLAITQDTTGFGDIVLTRSLTTGRNDIAKGEPTLTDNYSINVPWTVDPDEYTATVTYTVTQD